MTLAFSVSGEIKVSAGPGAVIVEFPITRLGGRALPVALAPADAVGLSELMASAAVVARGDLATLDPASLAPSPSPALPSAPANDNRTRRDDIREKIMSRVRVEDRGHQTPCWIWTGPTSGETGRGAGYPRMSLSGQTVAVHIVFWTNENGFVPGKKQLDHKCRQRLCVCPDHLELVTPSRNMRRMHAARAEKEVANAD